MFLEIHKNWLTARKIAITDKTFSVKANLLGLLKAEIERKAKDDGCRAITDADCIAVLKKFINNCDVTIDALVKNGKEAILPRREKNILENFLPKQLTREEIKVIILDYIAYIKNCYSNPTNLGEIMKYMKQEHDGRYDGKLVSEVAKECLTLK